jgi:hypothetical protein
MSSHGLQPGISPPTSFFSGFPGCSEISENNKGIKQMEMITQFLQRFQIARWSSELFRTLGLLDFNTWGLRLFALGVVLVVLGMLWVLVSAFRTRFWWGLVTLTVVLSPIFLLFRWKRARPGVLLGLLGVCTVAAAHVVEEYSVTRQLTARERVVDGELRITLTGWNQTDYGILAARPDAVVVQMANPDVTDETLRYLLPMSQIKRLDLGGTKITDAGLATIARLTSLEELNLSRTAVTDQGLKDHLFNLESLKRLNVEGTRVSSATAKDWGAAKPGRRRPLM